MGDGKSPKVIPDVLGARRVKLTLLIEGDPDAVDGWKLVTVEEVEVIK